jgi:hypothetical protein
MDSEQTILLINRHKAKLLSKLEEIKTPDAYMIIIKSEFHFLLEDIKASKEDTNNVKKTNRFGTFD